MHILRMTQKWGRYQVGERISVEDDATAARLCGDDNPRFKVAVRVPEKEAKQVLGPQEHKMVTVADEAKIDDEPPGRRGPGRPPKG